MAPDPEMKRHWLDSEQWGSRKKLKAGALVLGVVVVVAIVLSVSLGLTRRRSRNSSSPALDPITFFDNYNVSWSPDHIRLLEGGLVADVLLDKDSGAEFGSTKSYLFGHLSMQIKLVGNDSAGTVTAFYMSSATKNRDEFDFEFLGNRSGQPYALQTNVYVDGVGGREQRILLWFDPSLDYHNYSILWNQYQAIFFVDDTPVRVFRNNSQLGVPYAFSQPMRIFGSMWDGEQWATRGGLEKTNWASAPFIASFRDFAIDGCDGSTNLTACLSGGNWWDQASYHYLQLEQLDKLARVKKSYGIYDYCTDTERYSPVPRECGSNP